MKNEYVNHKLVRKFEYNEKIIQNYGDARVYRDCIMLTPGSWTDSMTRAPVEYTVEELSRAATNWLRSYLDLDHQFGVLDRVGYVRNQHWRNNSIMGDLYIYPITQNARDTISQIDAGLINELSVELMSRDEYDYESDKLLATDIKFLGCACVTDGACRDTKITDNPNYVKANY